MVYRVDAVIHKQMKAGNLQLLNATQSVLQHNVVCANA